MDRPPQDRGYFPAGLAISPNHIRHDRAAATLAAVNPSPDPAKFHEDRDISKPGWADLR